MLLLLVTGVQTPLLTLRDTDQITAGLGYGQQALTKGRLPRARVCVCVCVCVCV